MESKGRKNGLGYIYKYSLDGIVMYIGQTTDLDRRVKEHAKEINFENLTDIEFKGCLEKNLNDVEAYFISLYKPILNKTQPKIKTNNIDYIINHLLPWEKYILPEKDSVVISDDLKIINREDYITVKEAALLKKVSVSAIYKRIQCGTIPVVYIDNQQYVPKKQMEEEAGIIHKEINTTNITYNNSIILFLLDELERQKTGAKQTYINLIKRYFGVIINE